MRRLPPGFETVSAAKSRHYGSVNIIGAVVDALPPTLTARRSYMCTFTLKDCDFESASWLGLKVKYFHSQQEHLPAPEVGDVVLLRNLKSTMVKGVRMYESSQAENISWTLWKSRGPSSAPVVRNKPSTLGPTAEEREYALYLLNGSSVPGFSGYQQNETPRRQGHYEPNISTSNAPTPSRGGVTGAPKPSRKFCLLKDATFATYADITGQVVKTYNEGEKFILYVTDYTSNEHLLQYALPSRESGGRSDTEYKYINTQKTREWPGPFGTMTIHVTLWDPHASFARERVKVDDYVTLYNVNIKMNKQSGKMEGSLHIDRVYPNKIQVYIINDNETDPHIKQLVQRKQEYWRGLRTMLPQRLGDTSNKRQRSSSDAADERRKQKDKEKRQKQAEEKRTKKKDPDQPELPRLVPVKRDELNTHIRASNPAIPCRLIRDILDPDTHKIKGPDGIEFQLPFQNVRYRSSIRIVDFFPHDLGDFSVLYNPDHAILSKDGDALSDDSDENSPPGARLRWEWRFCLLVEDGGPNIPHLPRGQTRERMPLFVSGSDAEFLLQINAVNLRENPKMLAQLREKLFLLWGDLEERKTESIEAFYAGQADAVSAKPFTCCIKEYGVKARNRGGSVESNKDEDPDFLGWERRFPNEAKLAQDN
ncbi:telomere-binding alpha subunit central domain-containing protein [Arthroderma uncinatum]|uniref:telomere-binding alpha subunit central domain-containing protein n=1 Tax=Arthroderma uncinatum TaxID=74035 RepID=UPI00144A9516|nr:telomere-binding alpha subunit central domain-containing protein [Arthroderma uncinatum]KAF3483262.1 telomere-binding alpha subunit central domain-containing protein [Arthroderma uncinatum]